jgi:hypothetical protein
MWRSTNVLLCSVLQYSPAAVRNCTKQHTSYRYFGGGYVTGGTADRLELNYGGATTDVSACALWCQNDVQCMKWVYHGPSTGCYRFTSNYTGTTMDANFTSGSCFGSEPAGKSASALAWLPSCALLVVRGACCASCLLILQGLSMPRDRISAG